MQSECYCTTLRAAARRVAAAYDAALAPVSLNVAQFALLRRITRGEPMSLTDLGEAAGLDRSTVGRNVRVLERDGFVRLDRGDDQREAAVSLTPRGRDALHAGAPLWESCQRGIERRLGAERMRVLREVLREV